MKQILLFALMTFFVQTSFCQNLSDTVNVEYSKNSPKRWSLGFGVPPGSNFWYVFTPNLDNFLKSQKINPPYTSSYTIPLTYIFQHNRFKTEVGFNYSISYISIAGSDQNSVKLDAGYAIFAERNYFIYLNLGIGYGQYSKKIDFQPSQQPIVSLASVIQSGVGQTIVLKNTNAFLDFSIESMIRTKKSTSIGRSVKLGYHYGLTESAWTSTSVKLVDTPSDRMNGIYLQFTLNISRQRASDREVVSKKSSN
ncbi:MAG: hypothetical protein V4585_02250 [Bacteroidota bacterium]